MPPGRSRGTGRAEGVPGRFVLGEQAGYGHDGQLPPPFPQVSARRGDLQSLPRSRRNDPGGAAAARGDGDPVDRIPWDPHRGPDLGGLFRGGRRNPVFGRRAEGTGPRVRRFREHPFPSPPGHRGGIRLPLVRERGSALVGNIGDRGGWRIALAPEPLFIFDLDNTLYPPEVTLWRIVDARIEEYVRRKLGTDPETAHRIRKAFLAEFGTTLRGLMHHHDVLPGDYLEFVHDVPIPEIVPPRPELREMLARLPGRRVVFTNGSEEYARRVLDALGVAEMMEGIYGIEFMEYIAKPSPYPYAKLLRATGARGEDSLFCEDSRRNLLPAGDLGMFTVWVDGNGKEPPMSSGTGDWSRHSFRPHAVVADVCELPGVLHRF